VYTFVVVLVRWRLAGKPHSIRTIPQLLPKYRVALTKLRLASNKLKIVTGRYAANRINREQRICTLCVLREIEDDFHFVI